MGPREAEPLSAQMRREALKTLTWHWDGAYSFCVKDGKWIAERADGLGVITAATSDELADKVQADYIARPVPR